MIAVTIVAVILALWLIVFVARIPVYGLRVAKPGDLEHIKTWADAARLTSPRSKQLFNMDKSQGISFICDETEGPGLLTCFLFSHTIALTNSSHINILSWSKEAKYLRQRFADLHSEKFSNTTNPPLY